MISLEWLGAGKSVMARSAARGQADREEILAPIRRYCPGCGRRLRYRYDNQRTVVTLGGLVHLRLQIRRCETPGCQHHRRPYRPEGEGSLVLPQHEFGLDIIALIGALRYREHKSVSFPRRCGRVVKIDLFRPGDPCPRRDVGSQASSRAKR